jgi:DivIVA domain-containing protein
MDPDEIERRDFLVSLRGYSRDEVDSFMREVAQGIRELMRQLAAVSAEVENKSAELAVKTVALEELQGGEAPSAEGSFQEELSPQARLAGLKQEHIELLQRDRREALEELGEETRKILLATEQVAKEMHDRATRESAEIVTDARMEAERIFQEVEERIRREQQDLDQLKEVRGMVASQLEDIKRRLEETIRRLRTPVEPLPKVSRLRPATGSTTPSPPGSPLAPVPREAEPPPPHPAPVASSKTQEPVSPPPAETEPVGQSVPEMNSAPLQSDALAASRSTPNGVEKPGEPDPILQLLDEIRRERDSARRRRDTSDRAAATAAVETSKPGKESVRIGGPKDDAPSSVDKADKAPKKAVERPVPVQTASLAAADARMLRLRSEALSDLPAQASRRMKRLLQEDQNDLLDRLRTQRGRGALEDNLPSVQEQFGRFQGALGEVLGKAFAHGRKVAGAEDPGDSTKVVGNLVARQVLNPLRGEISRTVKAGLEAKDTPNSIAERASDIFRVWKGIRTELLGEGMVYAAFHQGLADVWNRTPGAMKTWVEGPEQECPNEVCRTNADAGAVPVQSAFPSGHINPPAHGGCTCTLEGPGEVS